jgi:opacity protein-like surface antigen
MVKRSLILSALALLFFANHALANPVPERNPFLTGSTRFYGGIFLGANLNNLNYDSKFFISNSSLVVSDWLTTFHLGFTGIYQLNDQWSFQLDYNNETKGLGYEDVLHYQPHNGLQLKTEIANNLRLNYNSFPLTAKYHFGRVTLAYIEAGPYYSFLNKAREVGTMLVERPSPIIATGEIITKQESFDINVTKIYRDDFGMTVGTGLIIPLSKGIWGPQYSIYINARYSYGFLNIYRGIDVEELNAVEELIGFEQELVDSRYLENEITTSAFTLRFGFVAAF